MRPTKPLALAMVALLLAACGAAVPRVTPDLVAHAQRSWPEVDAARLSAARELYVGRCGGCHNLPAPASVSAAAWPGVIHDMTKPAKLTPDQAQELLRFALAVRDAR